MDVNLEYIKMCEKAEEIQLLKDRTSGNYPKPNISYAWNDVFWNPEGNKPSIWLPRQDQLQEMIGDYETCKDALFTAGYDDNEYARYWGKSFKYWAEFKSMEQLWLAFVMSERYHKMWTGTDWQRES